MVLVQCNVQYDCLMREIPVHILLSEIYKSNVEKCILLQNDVYTIFCIICNIEMLTPLTVYYVMLKHRSA